MANHALKRKLMGDDEKYIKSLEDQNDKLAADLDWFMSRVDDTMIRKYNDRCAVRGDVEE